MKTFASLTDAEVELGRVELARYLGAEASEVMWMRRLALRPDGGWAVSVRTVRPAVNPRYRDTLESTFGPRILTDFHPIPEAIALVRGGAEDEADRLERVHRERQAASQEWEAKERETRRNEAETTRRHEAEWKEKRDRFGGDRWDAMPPWGRIVFSLALIFDEHDPDVARKLRGLGGQALGKRDDYPGPAFPGVEWMAEPAPPRAAQSNTDEGTVTPPDAGPAGSPPEGWR